MVDILMKLITERNNIYTILNNQIAEFEVHIQEARVPYRERH